VTTLHGLVFGTFSDETPAIENFIGPEVLAVVFVGLALVGCIQTATGPRQAPDASNPQENNRGMQDRGGDM
jgi:hypothetical protein